MLTSTKLIQNIIKPNKTKANKNNSHDRFVDCVINYLDLNHWLPDKHGMSNKNLKKFMW